MAKILFNVDVRHTSTTLTTHDSETWKHLDLRITILSLTCSCLILSLHCCYRSLFKKKNNKKKPWLWEQPARKPRGGSRVLGDLLSRNTCGGWSRGGRGVLPCRSGYPEQPRANHYHLAAPSMFTALLQVSMASTWRPAISDITSAKHTKICVHKTDPHELHTPAPCCSDTAHSVYTEQEAESLFHITFSIYMF